MKKQNSMIAAHAFCTNNKDDLQHDSICGCFYCLRIFSPREITEWIEDTRGTALCPFCGIDSVIGESAGYPITKEFLEEMQQHWFSSAVRLSPPAIHMEKISERNKIKETL